MLLYIPFFAATAIISPAFSNVINIQKDAFSEHLVPCEEDWYFFRDKCYKARGREASDRLAWHHALTWCKDVGGDLVSIHSQEEQDFIVSFLQVDLQFRAWIGLHDREDESTYMWSDGSDINYSNWNTGEPSGRKFGNEDCVHVVYEPGNGIVGKWNDGSCDIKEGYICEMNANYTKESLDQKYCSYEEGGGLKYKSSCYHLMTEENSWQNAEAHCKKLYNGHLVTIQDTLEDVFLNFILENGKEVWIGIQIQEQNQQKWTSGWYVAYNGFGHYLQLDPGACVARKRRKEWLLFPCSRELPFLCEVSKAGPPVLKLPPKNARCPEMFKEWRDFGGEYCYYIEFYNKRSFYEASFDCNRKGGHLVSFHSKEEAEVLEPFVKFIHQRIWIGLIRTFLDDDTFTWIDGSAFDYENWADKEPNNKGEGCVEAVNDVVGDRELKWNDANCQNSNPYICSVKKIIPNGVGNTECASHEALKALIGVFVAIILMVILMGVALHYFRPYGVEFLKKSAAPSTAPSSSSTNCSKYTSMKELMMKKDVPYETME